MNHWMVADNQIRLNQKQYSKKLMMEGGRYRAGGSGWRERAKYSKGGCDAYLKEIMSQRDKRLGGWGCPRKHATFLSFPQFKAK